MAEIENNPVAKARTPFLFLIKRTTHKIILNIKKVLEIKRLETVCIAATVPAVDIPPTLNPVILAITAIAFHVNPHTDPINKNIAALGMGAFVLVILNSP
jgi:hypothetical protein